MVSVSPLTTSSGPAVRSSCGMASSSPGTQMKAKDRTSSSSGWDTANGIT
jgi:hypothetical protein